MTGVYINTISKGARHMPGCWLKRGSFPHPPRKRSVRNLIGSGNGSKKAILRSAASWKISVTNTGVATVKAGSGTTSSSYRNWLRFNPNNGTPLFSNYGSGQQDIAIYVYA